MNIKNRIQSSGISSETVSELSKIPEPIILEILAGETANAPTNWLDRFALALQTPVDVLTKENIQIRRPTIGDTILQSDAEKIIWSLFKGFLQGSTGGVLGAFESAKDVFQELSKLGISELGWVLVQRSMCGAVAELTGAQGVASHPIFDDETSEMLARIATDVNEMLDASEVYIDQQFFLNPAPKFVSSMSTRLQSRLVDGGYNEIQARNIADRLPYYFDTFLAREFRTNQEQYGRLVESHSTPFDHSILNQHRWIEYHQYLAKLPNEPMFGESFGLSAVFVDLRCYCDKPTQSLKGLFDIENKTANETESESEDIRQKVESFQALYDYMESWDQTSDRKPNKTVLEWATKAVDRFDSIRDVKYLRNELASWLMKQQENYDPNDAIRFIQGGPGSGKSSSMKMYAKELGDALGTRKVVFVPLHAFSFTDDFELAFDRFCERHLPPLPTGLLNVPSEERLLLIFDGLDELSKAGRHGAEAASEFVVQVATWLATNRQNLKICVIFCGRPLTVGDSNRSLRKTVINLMPYFIDVEEFERIARNDNASLNQQVEVSLDQRDGWWKKFGIAKGSVEYAGIPIELKSSKNPAITELTREPLLNYLVALSRERGRIDFEKGFNSNELYGDLIEDIKTRPYASKELEVTTGFDVEQFVELFEQVALATWHSQTGRSATMEQVANQLTSEQKNALSGRRLDNALQNGIFKLLIGFYVQSRQIASGQEVFEFTHKSFSEYLLGRRLIRELSFIVGERARKKRRNRGGFTIDDALSCWVSFFGRTRLKKEIIDFVRNEFELAKRAPEYSTQLNMEVSEHGGFIEFLNECREFLIEAIEVAVSSGLPAHQLGLSDVSFHELNRYEAHSAESLVVFHSIISSLLSELDTVSNSDTARIWPPGNSAHFLIKKIRMFASPDMDVVLKSLRHFRFENQTLTQAQLEDVNFSGSSFVGCDFSKSNVCSAVFDNCEFRSARFEEVSMKHSKFRDSSVKDSGFAHSSLGDCRMESALFSNCEMENCDIEKGNFDKSVFERVNLREANMRGMQITSSVFVESNLSNVNFRGSVFLDTHFNNSRLAETDFYGVTMKGMAMTECDLNNAGLQNSKIREANFEKTDFSSANLKNADLKAANLREVNFCNACLSGANLMHANFIDADLNGADLTFADLRHSNIKSALNLEHANLHGAILK